MRTAPAADRNKEPIALVLAKHKPFSGGADSRCLEIASGTGQHVAHLARKFPHVTFQPTEYSGGSSGPEELAYGGLSPVFASIVAHADGLSNVLSPVELDAGAADWPVEGQGPWDAIFLANVCHISPYHVTEGLFRGAGRTLNPSGGMLFIYGPFMVDGRHTAPSNADFDVRLKGQNAEWGVRDATALVGLAATHGLTLVAREEMPANNFILCFERGGEPFLEGES